MKNMFSRSFVLPGLAMLALFAASALASAQTAGYDLLQTGSGASIDLTSVGLGKVTLNGVPIAGGTGTTDTIMHRTQDVPQGGGTVPLEVTALFMKSASSVTYNGQPVDVYVTRSCLTPGERTVSAQLVSAVSAPVVYWAPINDPHVVPSGFNAWTVKVALVSEPFVNLI